MTRGKPVIWSLATLAAILVWKLPEAYGGAPNSAH